MSLKNYEILEEIGSGGMGVVYKALDKQLEREVAIKKIKFQVNQDFNEQVLRFRREAKAIANLNHPNIVKIFELIEDEESQSYYMVMEFIKGKALDILINEEDLSLGKVLKISSQACDALNYIHQKQIIHRDIKPANFILSEDGILKLMDFGIARIEDSLKLTQAGTLMGSVLFMAPEQIASPGEIDERIDIYALGVTIYHLLSKDFPFQSHKVWELINKIISENPYPLNKANPNIPEDVSEIIMKAIATNKENRYQSVMEFKSELEKIIGNNTRNYSNNVKVTGPLSVNAIPEINNIRNEKTLCLKTENLPASETQIISNPYLEISMSMDKKESKMITENINSLQKLLSELIKEISTSSIKMNSAELINIIEKQKPEKQKDLLRLIKDKLNYYKILQISQISNQRATMIINEKVDENTRYFEIEEKSARASLKSQVMDLIELKKLESEIVTHIENLNRFNLETREDKSNAIGIIKKVIPVINSIEVILQQNIDKEEYLEIDINEFEKVFFKASSDKHNLKKSASVTLKCEYMNEKLFSRLNPGKALYRISEKSFNTEVLINEIENSRNILEKTRYLNKVLELEILNTLKKVHENFHPEKIPGFERIINKDELIIKNIRMKSCLTELKSLVEKNASFDFANILLKYISKIIDSAKMFPITLKNFEKKQILNLEQRKKRFQTLILEINQAKPEHLMENKEEYLNKIEELYSRNVPESVIKMITYYFSVKTRIPMGLNKAMLIEQLNIEAALLSEKEIRIICKILRLEYFKDSMTFQSSGYYNQTQIINAS